MMNKHEVEYVNSISLEIAKRSILDTARLSPVFFGSPKMIEAAKKTLGPGLEYVVCEKIKEESDAKTT